MKKQWLAALGLVSVLGLAPMTGCTTTPDGQGLEFIESYDEQEFFKFKTYMRLSVKVAVNRLLTEGVVTQEEVLMVADIVEQAIETPVVAGATSILEPILEAQGLTNDEIALIVLIAEQELISRGALDWLDPVTGRVGLSPRTKELLGDVVEGLRTAQAITLEEEAQINAMQL